MTEITDLSTTDSSNTTVTGESIDGAIANMGRMDNTLQAILGLLARSIRTNVLRFLDNADPTKKVALDLTGLPTATERTWTAPYYSGTLGLVSDIRGQIYGLTTGTNTTDPTNDTDIAAGSAVDSTGTVSMLLASGLTKRADANWSVGNNGGAWDTGSIGANGAYYTYLIRRPDTGVVDVCQSASASAPTFGVHIPAAYTQYRRIAGNVRATSVNRPYTQNGDIFLYTTPILSTSTTNPGTAAVLVGLSIPQSAAEGIFNGMISNSSAVNFRTGVYFSSPAQTDQAPSETAAPLLSLSGAGTAAGTVFNPAGRFQIPVNSSGQIRYRVLLSDASVNIYITTMGWVDYRGRFA